MTAAVPPTPAASRQHDTATPLVHVSWPVFADQLTHCLRAAGESRLADQVPTLRVLARCRCEDDFCQSFHTAPPPVGRHGPGHRTICLIPRWDGYLLVDVISGDRPSQPEQIVFIEVLHRGPLN